MKIIAFPFAGGHKYSFPFLRQLLPAKYDFSVIEYPGRGSRVNEDLISSLKPLLKDVLEGVKKEIPQGDYIIYGHSMGAMLGFLVAKELEKEQLQLPIKLVLSGCVAPSARVAHQLHELEGIKFWQELANLGGVPKEILQVDTLKSFFEPILRADLNVLSDYHYHEDILSIPIDIFYGSEEVEDVLKITLWSQETSSLTRIYRLSGNHFFIFDHSETLVNHLISCFN